MHHAALLLLADGRLPAGGYAHSGGLEPAIQAGRVRTLDDVAAFTRGRLHTVGRVAASFAAAGCWTARTMDGARLRDLDAALDARTPSPAARATSRRLGRQLLRTAARLRPDPRYALLGSGPHQPLALGLTCAVFDLAPLDAALAVLHETATSVTGAAVRLLSLDPVAAYTVLADLASCIDELAAAAAAYSDHDPAELPANAAPLLDLLAEQHAIRSGRLFAS